MQDDTKQKTTVSAPAGILTQRSDEELVGLIQTGSDAAFAELVKRYMHKSYSIAYQIVGDYEASRDLSQDVFIKIHRSIHTFKQGRKFFSWYYRILLNHCINYSRRRKVVSMLPFAEAFPREEEVPPGTDDGGSGESVSEIQEVVRQAVGRLSAKHRQIVTLVEFEDFSQEETAEILGISVGTVRSRLHYARKNLKKYLNKYIH